MRYVIDSDGEERRDFASLVEAAQFAQTDLAVRSDGAIMDEDGVILGHTEGEETCK